jgi:hypothetical protein
MRLPAPHSKSLTPTSDTFYPTKHATFKATRRTSRSSLKTHPEVGGSSPLWSIGFERAPLSTTTADSYEPREHPTLLAGPPCAEADVPALGGWEEQLRIEAQRQPVERVFGAIRS